MPRYTKKKSSLPHRESAINDLYYPFATAYGASQVYRIDKKSSHVPTVETGDDDAERSPRKGMCHPDDPVIDKGHHQPGES